MIDTHAHLDFEAFDRDRIDVISRAKNFLEFIINPTLNGESFKKALKVLYKEKFIYFSLGFHPHYAKDFSEQIFEEYSKIIKESKRIVGIGEVGLDFYRDISPHQSQEDVLKKFIDFSLKMKLPLVLHTRDSEKRMEEILDGYNFPLKPVLHCFSSSWDFFEYGLRRNFYISFSGNITYKNNSLLREMLKMVPEELLLLETDSPYIPPQAMRGKRNEPSFILYTLREAASLRGVKEKELEERIKDNALRAFRIVDSQSL